MSKSLSSCPPISLLLQYQNDLEQGLLMPDKAQAEAITELDNLSRNVLRLENRHQDDWLHSSIRCLKRRININPKEPDVKGLYFWGGVGRGKTYLMDLFFEFLPIERKLRLHFHRFMQKIHQELTEAQGEPDPLVKIASKMAKRYRVICLDEFFVKDITDAMILAGLLDALFKRGVILVTTSNIIPSGLYANGLQRARFIPAIRLLENFTTVVNVDGGVDYRLRTLEKAELFHSPLDDDAEANLQQSFTALAPEAGIPKQMVEVLGREIPSVICADDVVWFDFFDLCDGPRSQNDYIELSKLYHAVLISNVPIMSAQNDDQARRFINLIDEFYDRNVKLIITAAASIHELYAGGRLDFEFERTQSRLLEMQSQEYLSKEHRA